jgi:hypothetical protein
MLFSLIFLRSFTDLIFHYPKASVDTFSELNTAPFLPLSLLTLEAFTPPKTPSLINTHTNLDSPQ